MKLHKALENLQLHVSSYLLILLRVCSASSLCIVFLILENFDGLLVLFPKPQENI